LVEAAERRAQGKPQTQVYSQPKRSTDLRKTPQQIYEEVLGTLTPEEVGEFGRILEKMLAAI
jgi:hypothetical protein